jgi:hypothetical protein
LDVAVTAKETMMERTIDDTYRSTGAEETVSKEAVDLHLDDLEISEVSIEALTTEDSVGIPDLGATNSYYSCTYC